MDKYFLVFYADNGGREDCSVYYSFLTKAASKTAAIEKVRTKEDLGPDADLDAEMELIT